MVESPNAQLPVEQNNCDDMHYIDTWYLIVVSNESGRKRIIHMNLLTQKLFHTHDYWENIFFVKCERYYRAYIKT